MALSAAEIEWFVADSTVDKNKSATAEDQASRSDAGVKLFARPSLMNGSSLAALALIVF